MIDLVLHNGDLVDDGFGDLLLCEDEFADIVQTANNNIMMKYGDHMYHQELGNKIYDYRIKSNNDGLDMVIAECKDAILNGDIRVSDVKSMNATMMDDATCMIDYVLVLSEDGSEVDGKTAINIFNMKEGE